MVELHKSFVSLSAIWLLMLLCVSGSEEESERSGPQATAGEESLVCLSALQLRPDMLPASEQAQQLEGEASVSLSTICDQQGVVVDTKR